MDVKKDRPGDGLSLWGYWKEGGVTSVLGKGEPAGEGSDRLKYILAAFVVPKSRLEPVFCTLLKASRNMALWGYAPTEEIYPRQD